MADEVIHDVVLEVNGTKHTLKVPGDLTLLELLREELGLTGTKCGCGYGACGACTVLVDGEPLRSCTVEAAEVSGKRIQTIEGLAHDGRLDPVQEAFLAQGAFQCGFCTPGMIMRVRAFLNSLSGRVPAREEIESSIGNHICRCGSYLRIFDAIRTAANIATPPPPPAAPGIQPQLKGGE